MCWCILLAHFCCKICFQVSKYLLLRTKIWPRLLWMCCYLHSKLWRRARLLLELFASTVERVLSRVSYLPSDPTFFYWHVVALLRESYTFVQRNSHVFLALTDRAHVWSSMCRFLSPLIVLIPQDLDLTLYAQVCWLCCVLYMPYFGLVQARPWFRSSMWISSVAGISKILCTSEVASATRTW